MSQEERLHKAYFEGLETPFETSQRAEALAKDVFREAKDSETVLFVTHSNLISEKIQQMGSNQRITRLPFGEVVL